MWCLILGCLLSFAHSESCVDKDPYCSKEDCRLRPGYAIFHCRATCNQCTKETCTDSLVFPCRTFFTMQCGIYPNLPDYCPVLCGICDPYGRIVTPPLPYALTNATEPMPYSTTPSPKPPAFLTTAPTFITTPKPSPSTTMTLMTSTTPPHSSTVARTLHITKPVTTQQPLLPGKVVPAEVRLTSTNLTASVCLDKRPGCSMAACTVMPGVYLPECKKTCNNCNNEQCFDSNKYPCTVSAARNCRIDTVLQQYCPKLCGLCQNKTVAVLPNVTPKLLLPTTTMKPVIKAPTIPDKKGLVCKDLRPDVCGSISNKEACAAKPGYYLTLCQKTCNNCDGTMCMDSNKINCSKLMVGGFCEFSAVTEYCPLSCAQCTNHGTPKIIQKISPPGFHPSLLALGGFSSESQCYDRLPNCMQLSVLGWCQRGVKRTKMQQFCKRSCGYCPPIYRSEFLYNLG